MSLTQAWISMKSISISVNSSLSVFVRHLLGCNRHKGSENAEVQNQTGKSAITPRLSPIAEIGINHEGSIDKAVQMVDDAADAGCECTKFQCHIIEDEMIPNDVIPGNADESIWDIMARCRLSYDETVKLKEYVESKGMIYLSTPFSRAAANRLEPWVLRPTKSAPENATTTHWFRISPRSASYHTQYGHERHRFGHTRSRDSRKAQYPSLPMHIDVPNPL